MSQSDDGLTWTFKLRDGLVWSDGPKLKASDYIFALTRAVTTGFDLVGNIVLQPESKTGMLSQMDLKM